MTRGKTPTLFTPARAWLTITLLAIGGCSSHPATPAKPEPATAPTAVAPPPQAAPSLPPAPLEGRVVPTGTGTASVAFTADGRRAYLAHDEKNTLIEVDTATGSVLRTFSDPTPISKKDGCPHNTCRGVGASGVALSADGTAAFVTSMRMDHVSRIDLATGKTTWSTKLQRYPTQVLAGADGKHLWVFNLVANSLSQVDAKTGKLIGKHAPLAGGDASHLPFGRPAGMAMARDGTRLYVSSARANALEMIDARTHKSLGGLELGEPRDVQVDHRTGQVWAQYDDGLLVHDSTSLEAQQAMHYCRDTQSYHFALSADGEHVAVTLPSEKLALVASRKTGLLTQAFRTGNWPLAVTFTPDSRRLAVLHGGTDADESAGGMTLFDVNAPTDLTAFLAARGELFCRPE